MPGFTGLGEPAAGAGPGRLAREGGHRELLEAAERDHRPGTALGPRAGLEHHVHAGRRADPGDRHHAGDRCPATPGHPRLRHHRAAAGPARRGGRRRARHRPGQRRGAVLRDHLLGGRRRPRDRRRGAPPQPGGRAARAAAGRSPGDPACRAHGPARGAGVHRVRDRRDGSHGPGAPPGDVPAEDLADRAAEHRPTQAPQPRNGPDRGDGRREPARGDGHPGGGDRDDPHRVGRPPRGRPHLDRWERAVRPGGGAGDPGDPGGRGGPARAHQRGQAGRARGLRLGGAPRAAAPLPPLGGSLVQRGRGTGAGSRSR